jgi:hypothetical protein
MYVIRLHRPSTSDPLHIRRSLLLAPGDDDTLRGPPISNVAVAVLFLKKLEGPEPLQIALLKQKRGVQATN